MNNLVFKFATSDSIKTSYSQIYQDLFVLAVLDGKKCGTYLEIGAGDPLIGNNTFLLESRYNWTGLSIDLDPKWSTAFAVGGRKNFLLADALSLDFNELLEAKKFGRRIDYLSLDIDPSEQTIQCLEHLPLTEYRFSIITFEHDAYRGSPDARDRSRRLLTNNGYRLVSGNLSACYYQNPYEDWYLDATIFSEAEISRFKRDTDETLDVR